MARSRRTSNKRIEKKANTATSQAVSKININRMKKPISTLPDDLSKKVQNIVYGGTDCLDIMKMVNQKSPREHQITIQEQKDMCKKIANISNNKMSKPRPVR